MKSSDELLALVLKTAREDERIRAVTMEGSRASGNAVRDAFSDLDLTFFVTDIREFTAGRDYMKRFGEILIQQTPDDWYEEPYDYGGKKRFAFLTQYRDGNRIDLTFIDVSDMETQKAFSEPRTVLLNKDGFVELQDVASEEAFYIRRPGAFEFFNTVNEFRWIGNYAAKGLCRREFYYARQMMDRHMMDMFIKLLNWRIGAEHGFRVTTGAYAKHLKSFLSEEEMERFMGLFARGDYEDMWDKLFLMYDWFEELSVFVAEKLGFPLDLQESRDVREFMQKRREMTEHIEF